MQIQGWGRCMGSEGKQEKKVVVLVQQANWRVQMEGSSFPRTGGCKARPGRRMRMTGAPNVCFPRSYASDCYWSGGLRTCKPQKHESLLAMRRRIHPLPHPLRTCKPQKHDHYHIHCDKNLHDYPRKPDNKESSKKKVLPGTPMCCSCVANT